MKRPIGEPEKSFNEMIKIETDECVEWQWSKTPAGYGVFNRNGVTTYVHRLALNLKQSPPNGDKVLVLHKPQICHNRSCFNYRHLYWGDNKDNQQDRIKDNTSANGEDIGNSKLSEKDVSNIRTDTRSQYLIASQYGVSQSLVSRIKNRSRWSWL